MQQKLDAQAAADKLKNPGKRGALPPVPSIFEMFAGLATDKTISPILQLQFADLTDAHWNAPFLVKDASDCACVTQWLAQPAAQKQMAAWPAKYKKSDVYKSTYGKTTIIDDSTKELMERTEHLFQQLMATAKVLDISSVSTNWSKASHCWGFEIGSFRLTPTPSCAGMLRYMCMGEITVYLFDLSKVKKNWNTESMNRFKYWLEEGELTPEILKETLPEMQSVSLAKGSLFYVPCGWFLVEKVDQGPLRFGLRKSIFIATESRKESYVAAKELLAKDGNQVENMEKLLALFAASLTSS